MTPKPQTVWESTDETSIDGYRIVVKGKGDKWKWCINKPPAKSIIAEYDAKYPPSDREQARTQAINKVESLKLRDQRTRKPLKSQAPDCPVTKKRSFWSADSARFFRGSFDAKRMYKCEFCEFWHLTTKPKTLRVDPAA